ncbi:MAG: outer membrane protein assembly factor BamA [Candidatus Omnitrophica bacterium]|nr:outer membrane protein assembly factor BamA [Candidatus Omnitrophota bacterium]
MTKFFKAALAVLISVGLMQFSIVDISYSEDQTSEGKIIKAIVVTNNKAISTETILSKIKTKIGDEFSQIVMNEDLKRLYATEYFTDVSIDSENYEDGLKITLTVEEKTVIGDITFKGNKAYTAQRLKQAMKSKPDEMLNMPLLAQDIAEIRALYVKKGYPGAEVKYELEVDKELNKTKIVIVIDERTKIKISKVNIVGNAHLKTGNIIKVLGTKPSWLFNPGIFKEEVLEEDVDKVKSLYDDIGYLDVEVAPKLDYSPDGTQLFVTFNINEGKQYLVGPINVAGNIVLTEKDIRSKIKMKSGKPFSRRELRDDMLAIRDLYYMHGYMDAVVDVDQNVNPTTSTMDITYTIDPKEVVYVGKVVIRGNTKTREIIIRRELRIYPGDKFDGSKIKRSKDRLYNLGLFEDISFDTEPSSVPQVHNLIVDVKETKTGEFSFGGGYSSIDQFLGFVEIGQKNFDALNFPTFTGGGQQLTVRAEIGMVRQNYNIGWIDPWIFGWHEEGSKVISAGSLQLTQDTRDNIYNPGHGYILNGSIEDAGGVFMGDKEYVKGTATAALYGTFFQKFVVELKARAGWSSPYGKSNSVPIYERFFAGGANTIRGYKERKVGPRDPGSDEPIGGEALLLGNAEVTFPIYEKILKGAIFYDIGNVWAKSGDFLKTGDYKSGAGIGIRVNTPVGPFRLDWGYPLATNHNDTKEGEFYFSISRGF